MSSLILNPQDYFIKALTKAYEKYPLPHEPLIKPYLNSLLSKFMVSENLFVKKDQENQKPTLTFLLKEALESPAHEQSVKFQHLGDVALYLGGVFPRSLNKSLVGLDFYIQIGQNAYLQTAGLKPKNQKVFNTLAEQFTQVLDLLAEATELEGVSNQELLSLYNLYHESNSPRLFNKLVSLGVNPLKTNKKTQ